MWIIINSASVSKIKIANGETVQLTIRFFGQADKNGTDVKVNFTIDPYPDLKINNSQSFSENFTFKKVNTEYSVDVSIQNSRVPESANSLNASIDLDATAVTSGVENSTSVAILYN